LCFNDDSAFGDGSEEISLREIPLGMKIIELEIFEEISIEADVRKGFELDLMHQFGFKPR
jgi:hypothetical protein